MVIGKWSEYSVVAGFQTEPSDRWRVTIVKSEEEERVTFVRSRGEDVSS